MIRHILKTAVVLFIVQHSFAQPVGNGSGSEGIRSYLNDEAWAPRERFVDFQHMRLELSFDAAQGLVKGKVTHRFSPLRPMVDSVWLDGPGIRVSSVSVNGKTATWRSEKQGLWIFTGRSLPFGETDSLTVVYEANPRKGLYFIGWDDPDNISRKQIWSQGQGIDNRNWIPFYDEMNDKLTTEMVVTFAGEYKVLSNGVKLGEKLNKDGTRTWHYRMNKPHAPYLVMLGIGVYDVKTIKSKSGVPINLYYYPEWKDRVDATYRYSAEMMDFFEAETGVKYPWESYSQIPVQEFMYGAMENTTATVFGDFLFCDERAELDRPYVGVNAHELAHQWFGDYVTARSDAHHWLQESFATYYNMLFEREVYGKNYFDVQRFDAINNSLNETKLNNFPVAHSQAGSTRHYPKGAFILNMLKNVVGGREVYNRAIQHYLKKHPYGNVDSHDLLVAFNETTGMPLDWFWDQWIYKGGEPSYTVSVAELTGAAGAVTRFTVEQVHQQNETTKLFTMPIWFEVHYTDGSKERLQQWISRQTETVDVPNKAGKKIAYVLFDPNSEVMKSVSIAKPFEWLKNQALNAEGLLDRHAALVALREFPLTQRREVLLKAFAKETYYFCKSEIVNQLANDPDDASQALIRDAIHGGDANVQKAVLNSTTTIAKDLLPDFEKLLTARSYQAVEMALEKLSFEQPANANKYIKLTEGVNGTLGRNVEIKRLEVLARTSSAPDALKQLVKYTGVSYEFRTRVNAAQAIKRLNYFDELLMKNLVQASFSSNSRLAGPCSQVLNYFHDQAQYRRTIRDYAFGPGWNDWQRAKLKAVLN